MPYDPKKRSRAEEKSIKAAVAKAEKPRRTLTMFEQETIINYNREEKFATLFTYQKSLIKHMKKQGATIDFINDDGGVSFSFPKSWVRKPLTPRKERVID